MNLILTNKKKKNWGKYYYNYFILKIEILS